MGDFTQLFLQLIVCLKLTLTPIDVLNNTIFSCIIDSINLIFVFSYMLYHYCMLFLQAYYIKHFHVPICEKHIFIKS